MRGFFFPGFDGLKSSARCSFGGQLSTPTMLEAKDGIIVCKSPLRTGSTFASSAGGVGYEDVAFSVALNTVGLAHAPHPRRAHALRPCAERIRALAPPHSSRPRAPRPATASLPRLAAPACRAVCLGGPRNAPRCALRTRTRIRMPTPSGPVPQVDFVGNENVTFRYYDHLLASISPQGGHLQGGTSAILYGDRFGLLVAGRPEMSSFVRCRFGAHDPIPATIDYAFGEAFIRCSSSSSEAYGRTTTGYEFVSVAINAQNFLPALEGEGGCYDNPDACAAFKYYTESVYSLWPVSGPVVGGSDVTVSGEFSPGYDGVRTSARCLFKQRGVSTLTSIEPTSVQCASLAIPPQGNQTHFDFEMGVALNGAPARGPSRRTLDGCRSSLPRGGGEVRPSGLGWCSAPRRSASAAAQPSVAA